MACADSDRGSDELTEMFCEDCDRDGITVIADGFCVDCAEYMCNTCLKYHKKYLSNHETQDKTSMPQDLCLIKCSTHPKELLKFYCSTCDATLCMECGSINHQLCSNVGHIPTLVQSGNYLNELQVLKVTLKTLSIKANTVKQTVETNIEQLSLNRKEIFVSISEHQKEINEKLEEEIKEIVQHLARERAEVIRTLDEKHSQRTQGLLDNQKQLIKKMDEEAEKMTQQSKTGDFKIQNLASNSDKIISDIAALNTDIERNIGKKCQLFVTTKQSKHDVNRLNMEMHRVREESEFSFYEFTPESNINIASPVAIVSLGCLRCKSSIADKSPTVDELSTADKSPKVHGSENSQSEIGPFQWFSAQEDSYESDEELESEEELETNGYHRYLSTHQKIRLQRKGRTSYRITLKNIDKHKIMFMNISQVNRNALAMQMSKYRIIIIWPEKEGDVVLERKMVNCNKRRLRKERAVFSDFMESITVIRLPIDQELWTTVKEKLDNVTIDNPDAVVVFRNQKESTITVVGIQIVAKSLYTTIYKIIKKVMAEKGQWIKELI